MTAAFDVDPIVDLVLETDRRYFKEHPEAMRYVRRMIPGEWAPYDPGLDYVLVTKLIDGVRVRRPVSGPMQ